MRIGAGNHDLAVALQRDRVCRLVVCRAAGIDVGGVVKRSDPTVAEAAIQRAGGSDTRHEWANVRVVCLKIIGDESVAGKHNFRVRLQRYTRNDRAIA